MKKIAMITGASSGIGKEFAIQVAQKYTFDELWIIARRGDLLQAVADEIKAKNGNSSEVKTIVRPIAMDICGKSGAEKFRDFLAQQEKDNPDMEGLKIGLLINNAGFGTYGPFEETSINRQMEMIELNCTSVTGICGYALPYLTEDSVIINTASLAGFMPLGNFAVYAATKAYVLNFTIALAAELRDKGIKVCALCPGSVSSDFANIASNGARKEVKGGFPPQKVVSQCLKRAFCGKTMALYRPKWKFNAFLSRIVGRYTVARFTYKYNKRPRTPDKE